MTRARLGAALGLAIAMLGSAALAYVLPPAAILRRMAEGRDELHLFSLRVDGTATFFGAGSGEAATALGLSPDLREVQADATISLKLPGRCRLEVASAAGGRFAAVQNGGKKRTEGGSMAAASVGLEEICGLLGGRSGSEGEGKHALLRHLRAVGVNVGASSLARVDRQQVAYLVGDPADGKPQFFVLKDTFLPARIRFFRPGASAWEVRLLDYGSAVTGDWFPRVVEVFEGAELRMRFTSLRARAQATLPDSLF